MRQELRDPARLATWRRVFPQLGVVFDPERLLARYEAGEPVAELVKRPRLPEGVTLLNMLR